MNTTPDPQDNEATEEDRRLRGSDLEGAERPDSVEHAAYLKTRKPDAELRLEGEKDDLYDDGLEIEEDDETLAGTRGGGSAGAKG